MYNSITNYKEGEPQPEKDILEELIEADMQTKRMLEGATVIYISPPTKSLLLRAAEEIERLRQELGYE